MKLLIIAHRYRLFIKTLFEEMSNHFEEINVIIPQWKKQNYNEKEFNDKSNVNVYYPKIIHFLPFGGFELNKYIKKHKIEYDLIISNFLIPYGYLGNQLSKISKKKNIIYVRGFDINIIPNKNILLFYLIKHIIKKSSHLISVSDYLKKKVLKIYKKEVDVIPNGYDKNIFFPMNKYLLKKKYNLINKRVITNIGNLKPIKNQKIQIKAMKNMPDDLILFIIGGGDLKQELQKEIEINNLLENVKLLDKQPQEIIRDYINMSEFTLISSIMEGNPNVMFESLACGVPVISSNVGDVKKILEETSGGIIINENTPKMFNKAIKKTLESECNKKYIFSKISKYKRENIIHNHIKIIKNVYQKK